MQRFIFPLQQWQQLLKKSGLPDFSCKNEKSKKRMKANLIKKLGLYLLFQDTNEMILKNNKLKGFLDCDIYPGSSSQLVV